MKNLVKRNIIFTLSALVFLSVIAIFATLKSASANFVSTSELFDAVGISVITDNRISGDDRTGIALVSKREGASAIVSDNAAGEFSMDFKFYS